MINFSEMRGPLAAPLRALARMVPAHWAMPVLQGPLRGARWIVGSGQMGCWLGTYEAPNQLEMQRMLRQGDVVYDLGANSGFFTLLASRLVGPGGQVFAFEPMPHTLRMLRRNLELNAANNVTIIEAAVSDVAGELAFGGEFSQERRTEHGALRVSAVSLDDLWEAKRIGRPRLIKMDIEGGELPALRGMRKLLAATQPFLLIEFHGAKLESADDDALTRAMLTDLGYDLRRLSNGETVATPVREGRRS